MIEDSLVGLRAAKVPLPPLKGLLKKLVKRLVQKLAKSWSKSWSQDWSKLAPHPPSPAHLPAYLTTKRLDQPAPPAKKLVKSWSKAGQRLVKSWSKAGQKAAHETGQNARCPRPRPPSRGGGDRPPPPHTHTHQPPPGSPPHPTPSPPPKKAGRQGAVAKPIFDQYLTGQMLVVVKDGPGPHPTAPPAPGDPAIEAGI